MGIGTQEHRDDCASAEETRNGGLEICVCRIRKANEEGQGTCSNVEMCVIGTWDFRAFDVTGLSKLKQGELYVNNDRLSRIIRM